MNFITKTKLKIKGIDPAKLSSNVKLIGISGHVGRSLTTGILYQLLENYGARTALISETLSGQREMKSSDFFNNFSKLATEGYEYIVVEITGKGLKQKLYNDMIFDSMILTPVVGHENIFKNLDEYLSAKGDLISKLKEGGNLIIGTQDSQISDWLSNFGNSLTQNIFTYINPINSAERITSNLKSQRFFVENELFEIPYIGTNSLEAFLNAFTLTKAHFGNKQNTSEILSKLKPIDSHLEMFMQSPYSLFIDMSKSSSGLEESLELIRTIRDPRQKMIGVIGIDDKRINQISHLSKVLRRYLDFIIIAPTDPRELSVQKINNAIINNLEEQGCITLDRINSEDEYRAINKVKLVEKIRRAMLTSIPVISFDTEDYTARYDAIDLAMRTAQKEDIVYLVGKGNDTLMSFKDAEYEWKDSEAVNNVLKVGYL